MPVAHRFASCQNGQKMHPHPTLLPVGEGTPVTCCEVAWCARHRASFFSHFSPTGRDGRAAPVRAKEWAWERIEVRVSSGQQHTHCNWTKLAFFLPSASATLK